MIYKPQSKKLLSKLFCTSFAQSEPKNTLESERILTSNFTVIITLGTFMNICQVFDSSSLFVSLE